MQIEIETPGADSYAELNRNLVGFNQERSGWKSRPFTVTARGNGAELIGGVRGIVNLGLVDIRGLWVDPNHRGSGIGACIMRNLETHAISLGATRAALFTYDWQAREFYEKLGYGVFGTLELPQGATRYYMQKELDAPA